MRSSRKRRDGLELEREEIAFVISGYVKGDIPDYQVAAWLMAIYIRGLNDRELADLTEIMLDSGDRIALDGVPGKKIDKHSTGGVGDKISFIVAPLLAACGVRVPMLSGRGLGHTGGTLDKLEAIPGMNVFLNARAIPGGAGRTGMVICGQTDNIVPADKKLYALRDATATVSCIPLIASSIMSKKLALGSDGIVLDVKTGSGAFMKDEQDSIRLCRTMVAIGEKTGRPCLGIISSMDQPLGRAVGNSLEIIESIEALKGNGPEDIMQVTYALGWCMLRAAGKEMRYDAGRRNVPGGHRLGPRPGRVQAFHRRPGRRRPGLRRLFPPARQLAAGGIHCSGYRVYFAHRFVRRGHGRHRHRRRPPQKRRRHRLRQRFYLPRQRGRQGRKRPKTRDHPQRPPRTNAGGPGTPGPGDPNRAAARGQAENGFAPGGQGRRPTLAVLRSHWQKNIKVFFSMPTIPCSIIPQPNAPPCWPAWIEFRIPVEAGNLHRCLPAPQP